MDYTHILHACEEREHLINMVSLERIVELGYNIGLNKNSRVLDLGCGYGTMLKIWSEAFGISGVGIDREAGFIEIGKRRMTSDRIQLLAGDMFEYSDKEKFDIVVCTELSLSTKGHDVPFQILSDGVHYLERFANHGGKLIFGRLFSKIANPPKELTDFDGELPTLGEIYNDVKNCGYYITTMATDTAAEWERYITWSAKCDIEHLRQNPQNDEMSAWIDKWYRIYFDYRRPYEGWGLFGIEKL